MMATSLVRRVTIPTAGVVAAGLLVWLFWPAAVDVDTAAVRTGSLAISVADQGVARVRHSYVVSAPVAGRLERLNVEVGDAVVAGTTTLALIRPPAPEFFDPRTRAQAEAAVDAARSALASARAQRDRLGAELERANDQLHRIGDLAGQGVVAPTELVSAQSAARQAENAVRAADADIRTREANLTSAEMTLKNPSARASQLVTVTSPASGVVTHLLQQSERTVAAGTQLVEIGDTNGLEAAIEFLSQEAVKIRPGLRAEVYDWGGPEPIRAEVRLVEPQGFTKVSALGVEEQRTLVMLQFAAPPEAWAGLAPGYRVWGRVYLRELPAATLAPVGALVRDRGEWAVYRVEHGRARLQTVHIGALTDRDAEVLDGVQPGDQVIVYPSDQVVAGARVRPSQSASR